MILKLVNVRLGHCCNSSSSHSIIITSKGPLPDELIYGDGFGWDLFTAGSKRAKMGYVAGLILGNFYGQLGQTIVDELFGRDCIDGDCSVDHQSVVDIPADFDDPLKPDAAHLKWLAEFFADDRVAVLGGNDNDGESHPLLWDNTKVKFPNVGEPVCRQEGQNQWAYFNRFTGALARVAVDPVKPFYPELLDIKITDYCYQDCPYCYQGSNHKGEAADPFYLREIADWCHDHRIFSVALGGGDTTTFWNLQRFMEYFRTKGVVPNFTTREVNNVTDEMFQLSGSIAFSVDEKNLARSVTGIESLSPHPDKVVLQIVPAISLPILPEVYRICADHGWRVTLLGYKNTGRGATFTPEHDETQWPIYARPLGVSVSIDTVLAGRCVDELDRLRIPRLLFDTRDGDRTLYIDAVAKKMGRSSYEPETLVPAENLDAAICELRKDRPCDVANDQTEDSA